MDENFTRGYIQLQLDSPNVDTVPNRKSGKHDDVSDKCHCVYFALVLCGAGFLLPYNSFITAVDYYQNKYPGTTIIFDMSLTYICVALFGVTVNNFLVDVLRLHTRITFGYVLSFTTLILIALCDIWYDVFTHSVSYIVTLVAVGVVALGCTVQQSSFYGFTSMLPARYTQAVMTGESAAGLIVSINRVITKGLLPGSAQSNTIIFFVISIAMVMICCAIFHLIRTSDFVRHHMTLCRLSAMTDEQRKAPSTLKPITEEVSLVDILDGNAQQHHHDGYGVLTLHNSESPNSPPIDGYNRFDNPSFSYNAESDKGGFDNINYDPTINSQSQPKVKFQEASNIFSSPVTTWEKVKNGFHVRWRAARAVWPYMFSIGLAYFVTLSLFPGIESEVISCRLRSWMPVILISTFNLFDFIGKIIASIRYDWPRTRLVILTCIRLILVPLLMMCAAPRLSPVFQGEAWSICFSALLGLSNGYFGSVPMILAPSKVSDSQKEITGNMMMLCYSIGLTSGSIVAYLLDLWIGPHPLHPCTDHLSSNLTTTISFSSTQPYNDFITYFR